MATLYGHEPGPVDSPCPWNHFTTPPYRSTQIIHTTPLTLNGRWSDDYQPSKDANYDTYDFQSNHVDLESNRATYGLSPLEAHGPIEFNHLDRISIQETVSYMDISPKLVPLQYLFPPPSSFEIAEDKPLKETQGTNLRLDATPGLPSTWSFSTFIRSCDLATNMASSESSTFDGASSQGSGDLEGALSLSFETLSAVTGLSVADFAAHISASAETTLQQMNNGPYISGEGGQLLPSSSDESAQWNAPNLLLPLADSRLRIFNSLSTTDCPGVNMADILPPGSSNTLESPSQIKSEHISLPSCSSLLCASDMYLEAQSAKQRVEGIGLGIRSPHSASYLPPVELSTGWRRQLSDDECSMYRSPSSSEYSPTLRSTGLKRTTTSRISTRRIARTTVIRERIPDSPDADFEERHLFPLSMGTPVLDAHRGIDIEDLKAKAERYRLRNVGRDYDKRWLIQFAGKLSSKGEFAEEFRCYVIGCTQANKRRDHILIHVGGHLDQRPFKCDHWWVSHTYSCSFTNLCSSSASRGFYERMNASVMK